MTAETFNDNLSRLGVLQAEAKRRSMIFNAVEKELAARFYGMPIDSFYELPFTQWIDVAHHYYKAAQSA